MYTSTSDYNINPPFPTDLFSFNMSYVIRFNFYIQFLPVILPSSCTYYSSYFKNIACSWVKERCWKLRVFITLIFFAFWEFFHCHSGFIHISLSNTWNHAGVVFGISLLLISSQNSHQMHFSAPCKT